MDVLSLRRLSLATVEGKKLYEKLHNFHFQNGSSDFTRSTAKLCLSLDWHSTSSGMHSKELLINLTDPDDPFFLYLLTLTADDFLKLKRQQGLLVEFDEFPENFINFLELCLAEENKSEPKYLLSLDVVKTSSSSGMAQLEVVETNRFKLVTQLSLKLMQPEGEMMKTYLITLYKNLKELNQRLESKILMLEKEIYKRDLQSKEAASRRTSELKTKEANYAKLERQFQDKIKAIASAEAALEEQRLKFESEIEDLQERLQQSCKDSQETIAKSEKEIEEYKAQIKELNVKAKSSNSHTLKLLKESEEKNRKLKDDLQEALKRADDAESEIYICREKIDSMEVASSKMKQELDSLLLEKSSLQACLLRSKSQVEEKNREYQNTLHDMEKSNDIVRKLQNDIRNLNEVIRSRVVMTSHLEGKLHEKKQIIKRLQQDAFDLSSSLEKQREEHHSLLDLYENLKCRLKTTEQLLLERESMLNFLKQRVPTNVDNAPNENVEVDANSVVLQSAENQQTVSSQSRAEPLPLPPPNRVNLNVTSNPKPDAVNGPVHRDMSLDPRYFERHPRATVFDAARADAGT